MSNGEFHDDKLLDSLRAVRRGSRTEDCPEEERLRFFAVGLTEPNESQELLAHATACDYCGPLLREAVQDLGAAPSAEEVQFAATTRLANPRRRLEFAEQLAGQTTTQSRWAFRIPKLAYWLVPATAVATLAGIFIAIQPSALEVAKNFTNQAYTAHRTLPLRFPGAAYSPLQSVEMGGETSRLNRVPELYDAEANIERGRAAHPDDPQWLRLKGEADLLEDRPDTAITELERARALRPDDAYILSDLGIAYYQKAQNGEDQYYARAFEVLTKALELKPNDPVLLFNRALAAGQLHAFNVEKDAWDAYLRVDPKGGWAGEARQHLDEIKRNSGGNPAMPAPPLQNR